MTSESTGSALHRFLRFFSDSHKPLWILLAAILCAAAGGAVSSQYLEDKDLREFRMWQSWYGPAVSLACGYGFSPVTAPPDSAVGKFLRTERNEIDCSEVMPPGPEARASPIRVDNEYLIALVGFVWKFTGVDWQAVKGVIVFLYMLMAVAAFFLARALVGNILALAVTLLFISVPENLEMMTRVRDFGKAPFVFLVAGLLVWAARSTPSSYLKWAIAVGASAGVGLGFRPDVAMVLPVAIMLIAITGPKAVGAKRRWLAAGLLAASFAIMSSPVTLSKAGIGNGNFAHVTILGLSNYSNYSLSLQPGNYTWGVNHEDMYVLEAMNAYAAQEFPSIEQLSYATPTYQEVGIAYLLDMFFAFPADMITRVGGAAVTLADVSLTEVLRLESAYQIEGWQLVGLVVLVLAGLFALVLRTRAPERHFQLYSFTSFRCRHCCLSTAIFSIWNSWYLSLWRACCTRFPGDWRSENGFLCRRVSVWVCCCFSWLPSCTPWQSACRSGGSDHAWSASSTVSAPN